MSKALLVLLLVYICIVPLCQSHRGRKRRRCGRFPSNVEYKRCITCTLFKTKNVTLVARNILREPTFDISVNLNCTRSKFLFYMMQEAADVDKAFRFTVKYFGNELGFFVDAINDMFGNFTLDQTWWQILDGDMKLTPVGVSNYKPSNGETVTFNFTQGSGHTS